MAYNIIRPRKGIKSLWEQYKSRIYKSGEMLVESPETGIGSGPVNIKFGDGITDYEHLPYGVMAPISEPNEESAAPLNTAGVMKAIEENAKVPDDVLNQSDVVDNFESDSGDLPASARTVKVLNENLEEMKTSFQGGCDAIYDAIVAKGVTPESKSLEDIITAINSIQTDVKHTVKSAFMFHGNNYFSARLYVDGVLVGSGPQVNGYNFSGAGEQSSVTAKV